MGRWLSNVYRLGLKEFSSLASDKVLFAFIIYSFSLNIYSEATGIRTDVNNAAIAIVDSDRSALSARIRDGLLKPYFRRPDLIDRSAIDREMNRGTYAFVLDIPPNFEAESKP
jgi:ABC-2 type transport system permease protein